MFRSGSDRANTLDTQFDGLSPTPSDDAKIPDFVLIDVETACGRVSSICQIGIVAFRGGKIAFEYETLIDPRDYFSSFNTRIHGITADHVEGKPCFGDLHDIIEGHLTGRVTDAAVGIFE